MVFLQFSCLLLGVKERTDIVFAIDSSGGVNGTMFNRMKKLVKATLGSFKFSPTDSRGAIVGFGSQPQLANNLYEGTDARTIESTIDRLNRIGGVKEMSRALRMIRTDIFGNPLNKVSHSKRVVILLTTGKNISDSASELERAALELRSQGVEVIPVVIGKENDQKKLDAITGKSSNLVFVDDARRLPLTLGPLEAKIREAGSMYCISKHVFPLCTTTCSKSPRNCLFPYSCEVICLQLNNFASTWATLPWFSTISLIILFHYTS